MMETAYYKFKDQFPDEEPFFRITCTRKYGRADRQKIWRPKNLETRVVFPDKSVEITNTEISSEIKLDKAVPELEPYRTRKQQEEDERGRTDLINPNRIMARYVRPQKNKIVDYDTRAVEVTKVPYDACVDLRMDEPISVGVFKYCIDSAQMLLKEIRTEYKVLMDDPLFKSKGSFVSTDDIDSIQTIEDSLKTIASIKMKEEEMRTKILQVESTLPQLTKNSEELDSLNKSIKLAFKESATVQEVVTKYIDVQKKLNELKSFALPLMRKYSEMPFMDSVVKYGFISTLKEFIEYLHQNTADDYVSELKDTD